MRKPWIVVGMAALLAIGGTLALGMTAQPTTAADATTTEETTAPAVDAATTEETTTEEPVVEDAAAPVEQPAEGTASEPAADTAEQPAETAAEPAETAAEPAVEAAPAPAAEQVAEPEEGIYPDDRILGSRDAPITMIEYASLSCPHCAAFHAQVMPQLKADYIDKGEVRFIYRDFPLNWPAVQAALLTRCAKDDTRYFGLVDTLFKLQNQWLSASDPGVALTQIGALAGMSKETVDACLADKAAQDKLLQRRQEAEATFGIESTPSFVVNGKLLSGGQTIEMLQETFKELSPKG